MLPDGPGDAFVLWFGCVADQPVRPEIGDFDLKLVFPGFEPAGNVHAPRRTPDDAEVLSINDRQAPGDRSGQ